MNLTEVKKSLEGQFARELPQGAKRHIVFWYDAEGVFADIIYKFLAKTRGVHAHKHPRHADSMQASSRFTIEFLYTDGRTDMFKTAENPSLIYRFLKTKGSSGDPGFIIGVNEELYDFVSALCGN